MIDVKSVSFVCSLLCLYGHNLDCVRVYNSPEMLCVDHLRSVGTACCYFVCIIYIPQCCVCVFIRTLLAVSVLCVYIHGFVRANVLLPLLNAIAAACRCCQWCASKSFACGELTLIDHDIFGNPRLIGCTRIVTDRHVGSLR